MRRQTATGTRRAMFTAEKAPARAGTDRAPDIGPRLHALPAGAQLVLHLLVHRVLPLGAIERDGRDAIGDLEAHRLHAAPLTRRRAAKPPAGAGAGSVTRDGRARERGHRLRFDSAPLDTGPGATDPCGASQPPLPCCAVTDRGFPAHAARGLGGMTRDWGAGRRGGPPSAY